MTAMSVVRVCNRCLKRVSACTCVGAIQRAAEAIAARQKGTTGLYLSDYDQRLLKALHLRWE